MPKADIKLGYSCNNNCVHCVIADQREAALKMRGNQDRTTEEYKKELFDSRVSGCDCVVFTGGEPTIRPDIFELLTYAKLLNLEIGLQTNGRMFCYPAFAEKFKEFEIEFVVALHGHTEEIHDSITRVKGSFKQTINGIKNLNSINKSVIGKNVISKKNYTFLPKIAELFISLGVNSMNFAFPHAQGNARKYAKEIVPTYGEIEVYVKDTVNFVNDYNKKNNANIKISFEAIPLCFMREIEEHCSDLETINDTYTQLKQLDNKIYDWNELRKQIKKKAYCCKECKYGNVCEGVWFEYFDIYGDSEFKGVK